MPIDVVLPRIDVDSTTGKIAHWFAKEGASVTKGEPLFEMESDKAAVEVESPAAGVIRDITASAGNSVPIGSVVARIFSANEAYEAPPKADVAPARSNTPAIAASSDVKSATKPQPDAAPLNGGNKAAQSPVEKQSSRPRATPLARRLAQQHSIALEKLAGSGPNGRIQKRDVLQAAGTTGKRSALAHSPMDLHFAWLKTGEGSPIVFVHGFGSELGSWRHLIAGDAISRPLLAIDLPGHGESPLEGDASLQNIVDAVENTILKLGVTNADLVGHSLGGAVAATLATSTNIGARSLMLISPAGLGPDINGAFLDGFCRASSEASLTPWLQLTVKDEAQLNPAFVKGLLRRRLDPGIRQAQERLVASLFPDSTQSFSIRQKLSKLSMPVKVVFGVDDRIIPARHTRGLPGTVAVHLFENVGHMPHIEARSSLLQLLLENTRRRE